MTFETAQIQVVQSVATDFATDTWVHAIVDLEILEFPDGYDIDVQAILITRDNGQLASRQFQLSQPTRDAVAKLYRQRKEEAGDKFGGFVLRIDHPGRYRFDFRYEKPKRLSGVWDAERQAYFDNYLEHYRAEVGAQ
ncbi:hypothetical protein [Qipengyuania qiaonensis]|uniref:DUF600 family protein n=1 Tax=Qipengyuania qiaonensis TaxID=2867240 RepID=A0ABS7J5Z6_9SPHN|nr:hypothetical protein [Qipengyuania qiaonensis]MBX7482732.1 hypothetical protein [Qipengyuania qiaonensis]